MCEIYQNTPYRHKTEILDKDKQENLNNLYEKEPKQSPQNLPEVLPKNNPDPLQEQNTPETPNDSASTHKPPLIGDELNNHFTIIKETYKPVLLLSTNLTLKSKRHMYSFLKVSEKLTLDGLTDTGAVTSAISEQYFNKIKLLAPEAIFDNSPAPNFQIMVADGQLETDWNC